MPKRSSSDRYKGEWKDGMMHGQGTFMWSKGDMYEGDWKAGKMHGHGVKKMGNGDVYEGEPLARRIASGGCNFVGGFGRVLLLLPAGPRVRACMSTCKRMCAW